MPNVKTEGMAAPRSSNVLQASLAARLMVRVLIVSDVRLLREGLARELGGETQVTIVDSVRAADAVAHLEAEMVNSIVLLADWGTIRGTDLPRRVRERGCYLVVFAVADGNEEDVLSCAEAGVSGLLACDVSIKDLVNAIETAARGDVIYAPKVAAVVMRRVVHLTSQNLNDARTTILTRREREVAALLYEGSSNKEIAAALGIETATVKNHVHNVLAKLQVRRRGEVAPVLRDPTYEPAQVPVPGGTFRI